MSNIRNALTRKFGPLPAWAYLLIFGVGVWWYRRRFSKATGTGTGSVAPASGPPQSQVTLQPGESVYDPNTGALTTAPGGANSSMGDPSTAINDLANAITAALEAQAPPEQGSGLGPGDPSASLTPTGSRAAVGSSAGPHGAIVAPYGKKKPPNKRGYRTVGVGNGSWIYIPSRGAKGRAKRKPLNLGRSKGSGRARSNSTVRSPTHSHQGTRAPARGRSRTVTYSPQSTVRNRQKTGVTRQVTRQHPVAAHRPPHREQPHPQHRPSAPPPRKHRVIRRKHR